MPKNKKHHYVTAAYLELWKFNEYQVYQYDLIKKNSHSVDPRTVCKKPYLYLLEGVNENQKLLLDEAFQEIESDGMAAIHKIISKQILTKEERGNVAWFIAIHRLRTLRSLNDHERLTLEMVKRTGQRLLQDSEKLGGFVKDLELKKVSDIEEIKQNPKAYFENLWQDIEQGKYTLKVKNNRQMWLPIMFYAIEPLAKEYMSAGWYILRAGEGCSFITSDDPVVHLSYLPHDSKPSKENVRDIEVTFPLSPKVMLIIRIYDDRSHINYCPYYENTKSVKELNIRTFTHANKFIFSNNNQLAFSLTQRFYFAWQQLKLQDNITPCFEDRMHIVDTSKNFPRPVYRSFELPIRCVQLF